jgi:epoxyqueuosine reductase
VALGNLGDPAATAALAEALRGDRHPLVRGHAAWALGRIGGAAARAALDAAARDDADGSVRSEARAALDDAATR